MTKISRYLMLAAMAGCACFAFGQAMNSGDITGTVTDSSGAVVPGVSVNILDVDKGVTHSFVTNEAGAYDTGPVVPDHYLLTFTREGFETYKRGPITVSVGMLGIDVQMTVGTTSPGGDRDYGGAPARDDYCPNSPRPWTQRRFRNFHRLAGTMPTGHLSLSCNLARAALHNLILAAILVWERRHR